MNIDHYQKLAARTRVTRGYAEDLTHSSMGVVGEFGELVNKIKKMVYHKHDNLPEIIEELGDCLWYLADIATTLEVDLHTVAAANIGKLVQRYPDGFSPERSINRDEVANEHVIERSLNLHIWQSEEPGQYRITTGDTGNAPRTTTIPADWSSERAVYSADDAGEWVRV